MNSVAILVVVGLIYFLPTFNAHHRQVPSVGSVAVINLFLGWTFIGWVVALAMSARTVPEAHLQTLEAQRQAKMERRNQELLAKLDAQPRKTIRLGGQDLPDHRRDEESPAKGPVIRRSY